MNCAVYITGATCEMPKPRLSQSISAFAGASAVRVVCALIAQELRLSCTPLALVQIYGNLWSPLGVCAADLAKCWHLSCSSCCSRSSNSFIAVSNGKHGRAVPQSSSDEAAHEVGVRLSEGLGPHTRRSNKRSQLRKQARVATNGGVHSIRRRCTPFNAASSIP